MRANVCCVKYNPASAHEIAVGSADHSVHLYDLRNVSAPVHVFAGAPIMQPFCEFILPFKMHPLQVPSISGRSG